MRIKRNFKICGVLVGVLVCSQIALPATAQPTPFRGVLAGVETYQFVFDEHQQPIQILVHGRASGNATHLGRFTVDYAITVDLHTGSGPAAAHFIAANGNSLFVTGLGQAHDVAPGVVQIEEQFTIAGGTGRFSGATGAFTVDRVVTLADGLTHGTLDGHISR